MMSLPGRGRSTLPIEEENENIPLKVYIIRSPW